jgi:hypothetical protein
MRRTVNGHNHAEAFMLMRYVADDGSEEELIWNSRDGVTPFVISLRSGKQATHKDWTGDRYLPGHKPQPGDRIFVDLTEEAAKRIATEAAARHVEEGHITGKALMQYGGQAGLADFLAQSYLQLPGAPHLEEVTA